MTCESNGFYSSSLISIFFNWGLSGFEVILKTRVVSENGSVWFMRMRTIGSVISTNGSDKRTSSWTGFLRLYRELCTNDICDLFCLFYITTLSFLRFLLLYILELGFLDSWAITRGFEFREFTQFYLSSVSISVLVYISIWGPCFDTFHTVSLVALYFGFGITVCRYLC